LPPATNGTLFPVGVVCADEDGAVPDEHAVTNPPLNTTAATAFRIPLDRILFPHLSVAFQTPPVVIVEGSP